MKKWIWSLCLSLCCWNLPGAPLDSLRTILQEYTSVIEHNTAEFKADECDYLILACRDSALRAFTAQTLFEHYASSKIMNDEAVCVYLFDRWFAKGKVKFANEDEYVAAQIFAQTHRNSLLGMKAPPLCLLGPEGTEITLPSSGRSSLLFFYTTDCAVCKLYSKQLEIVLSRHSDVDCYAIYCGTDGEEWEKYRRERLNWKDCGTVYHVWDPEGESRFALSYGIVSTPRLFLCDEDGVLIGRGLDPAACQQIIEQKKNNENYAYGSEEANALFDELLPAGQRSPEKMEEVVRSFKWVAIERGDKALYRHLLGDLMYYLSRQHNEESIATCDSLIRRHILSGEVHWKGENDSLSVVHLAQMLQQLHAKSAIGSPLPPVYVQLEECRSRGKAFQGKIRLDKLKKRCRFAKKKILLLFYDPSCRDCEEQIAKARALQDPKTCVFLINVEQNQALLDTAEWDEWLENFDLSSLPYLILYDKEGKVSRRYFQL